MAQERSLIQEHIPNVHPLTLSGAFGDILLEVLSVALLGVGVMFGPPTCACLMHNLEDVKPDDILWWDPVRPWG